ncbi:MAG: FAD-dependent oxidoreductase, partial [Candidatus Sacchiramonaceae bacterium]|nr:FAD-dependent oxidoreductase [Candidatus Saccharimonadaceae bacterium]
MSKIAKYLNGYILGEVSARESRLKQFTQDKSILSIKPNLVMFPWITEDIRKIMRFSWQLAEKKHTFNVTARGYGGSTDGSSLGDGIIVDVSRHMNKIYELDLKQRLVRVAAGANFRELNLALGAQALTIAQSPAGERLTIGGAIAQN